MYIFVFLIVWSIQLLHNYLILFDEKNNTLENISFFAMFITGTCLAVARVIVDPYHWWLIKYNIYQWFGVELKVPEDDTIS